MMRYAFFFVLCLIGVSACKDEQKQLETLLKTSQGATDSLNAVIQEENQKRELLAKEIEELDILTKSLGVNLAAEKDPEKQKGTIERIKEAATTLKTQKDKIAQLTAKVAKLQAKLEAVTAENERLKEQISKLAGENLALKTRVDSLTRVTASLKARLDEAVTTTNNQRDRLNTGYYIIGGTGFLRDKGVLEKRGFSNAYNPTFDPKNRNDVTRIDISSTTEIDVPAPKSDVILWSPHVRSSYEVLEKAGDKNKSTLRIKDADQFWQTAKVLAIGTEG